MCFFGKKKKDKLANELLRGLSDASNNRDKLFNGQKYDQDDYGFSPSNPIMTSTVSSTTRYLNCLRTEDGFPVKWNRLGSLYMNSVHGVSDVMVDKYQLTVDDAPVDTIYICPYGHQSQHAPKGYQLVE